MSLLAPTTAQPFIAREIRVRGRVQGVGFRPTVWRRARELGLRGEVLNDAGGVVIRAGGSEEALAAFVARLESEPPPLARIDRIETAPFHGQLPADFRIAESVGGEARTQVSPDAAICVECAREVLDPFERRYRYPFTNCTHCGPRLTISGRHPLRPRQDHHGAVPAVRRLPRRISRPGRPPLPRRGHRLPRLRAEGDPRAP